MTKKHESDWQKIETIAESMIPMIGRLYRDKNVVITIYGRSVINRSVIELLKTHSFVQQIQNCDFTVEDTFAVLQLVDQLDLIPCRLDIGKIIINYKMVKNSILSIDYLKNELKHFISINSSKTHIVGQDIILYGFGRIGRLLARILIERSGGGQGLNLRAIVVRKSNASDDLYKRAALLRRDSVHGAFRGVIRIDEKQNKIYANGVAIDVIYSNAPDTIDYTEYGIDNAILVDNTGIWRDEEGLGQHLKAKGVSQVVLTAPGKGAIKNIVYGVNHHEIATTDKIISAASCTTNAITPVLKVVDDHFKIQSGHVETVHSYTNDQNLIDNYHKGARRGRSAALNMVLTTTGAAKAVGKALPHLSGKLTGSAIRVPTPNVSLAVLNLQLSQETTVEELNGCLREAALHSKLHKQIDFTTSEEVVSIDFVGNHKAGIVDSHATIVSENRCVLYIWYDNEFGYSCQVNRILHKVSNCHYPIFPE